MKRLLILAVLIASSSSAELKVGFILPLSGDAYSIAEASKNGAIMAEEDLNGAVKVVFADDRQDAKNAVTGFKKLTTVDGVTAIITWASNTSLAVAPLAEAGKIPMLAIASSPDIPKGRNYVFNLWVTPEEETKVLLPAIQKRGYKKIARISTTHDGAFAVNQAFDKINNGSTEIVLDEDYPVSEKDFKPYIAKLKAEKGVDAVMPILFPGQLSIFAKQLKEAKINLPLLGYELFEDSNEVKAAAGALDGALYANAANATAEFKARYKKRFPEASEFMASNAYDAVMLFVKNSADFTKLKTVKDYKATSGVISCGDDNRFIFPATLKRVNGDKFETVSE